MIPGRAVCAEKSRACKGEKAPCGDGAEEDLVKSHVAFDHAGTTDDFGRLSGCVCTEAHLGRLGMALVGKALSQSKQRRCTGCEVEMLDTQFSKNFPYWSLCLHLLIVGILDHGSQNYDKDNTLPYRMHLGICRS